MKPRGSFPVATIGDDLTVERELLEAPGDEAALLGGHDVQLPPYVEIALAGPAPGLDEALARWHAEAWGGTC